MLSIAAYRCTYSSLISLYIKVYIIYLYITVFEMRVMYYLSNIYTNVLYCLRQGCMILSMLTILKCNILHHILSVGNKF